VEELTAGFNLTCWYLNLRRVAELVGARELARELPANGSHDDHWQRLMQLAAAKRALVSWLHTSRVDTLGQTIVAKTLKPGRLFTHFGDFYCKGLPTYVYARRAGRSVDRPLVYAKLADYGAEQDQLRVPYDPVHLTSQSAYAELSGRRRLLLFGLVTDLEQQTVLASPYAIASLVDDPFFGEGRWLAHREVFIDEISNFARVDKSVPLHMDDLEILRAIPEKRIKQAFALIIGEPVVPRDWGGERSDLYSTMVRMRGERISTAFALKGPARFEPLKLSGLGKNGDQIDRLFSEPADLLVLQHCHVIDKSVRSVMRAYAERIGAPRLFCLIDGFDTLRILRDSNKTP